MITIRSIEVRGTSEQGSFMGRLAFRPGLQVISGPNSFGKSLAVESIAWCLGLEAIFGRKDSDPSFLPEAVLEELDLPTAKGVRVISSEAELTIQRHDQEELTLTRGITHDRNRIRISRQSASGLAHFTLSTGLGSMTEESTGFQRFLFEWLGWPRKEVTTFEGAGAYVYLENLAPLFYIEQTEGWTEVQARQIGRYGQQQIRELAVEYVLGAIAAVDRRVTKQRTATLDTSLRTRARAIADRANESFLKQGWAVDWSGNGSVKEIEARWSSVTVKQALRRDAEVDIPKLRGIASERAEYLRRVLTKDPVDPANMAASSAASQRVVDLKQRRHRLNAELRSLRGQYSDNEELLESLIHRIRTSTDVYRLKTTGVGRLAHLECPTCHRELDVNAFHLTDQTAQEVQAHIEALKRDRALTRRTLEAISTRIRASEAEIGNLDRDLHAAQRALEDVSVSVGPAREQLVNAAANLSAQERVIERLDATATEVETVQKAIDDWLLEARAARAEPDGDSDIDHRIAVFTEALKQYLNALGHNAVLNRGTEMLRLDRGQYEPYLADRRLRALGSGSDPARLVAAYALALAAAAVTLNGLHPGVVILDEPLQQNPDTTHRTLFLEFLSKSLAKHASFQTLVFTFLSDSEVETLRTGGTTVVTLEGHLLAPVSTASQPEAV